MNPNPNSTDARLERIETRLCKLMLALGLDPATGIRADPMAQPFAARKRRWPPVVSTTQQNEEN